MPLIVGLDIASVTGIGFVEPSTPPRTWRAIALEAEGESVWEKVDDFEVGLRDLLSERLPDFAVIERPLGVVVDYGGGQQQPGDKRMINATTTLTLAGLAGAAIGVLNGLGVPYGMIADRTWRASYFGKGFKPTVNWKVSAVEIAELQGILLPGTKKAAHDAAEAIGIGVSWASVNWIPARHRAAFLDLRTGKVAA